MLNYYQQAIDSGKLQLDAAQQYAVVELDKLASLLNQRAAPSHSSASAINRKRTGVAKQDSSTPGKASSDQGIYCYGPVGRGKTMLMDLFYQHLQTPRKQRIHFHRFMHSVHQQLIELSGQAEPLTLIANTWAARVDVLCFDEFFVNDIADAMLLAGLLQQLFNLGVLLVATSNCHPDQLYRNGLQRQRFLPTISLLQRYCQIIPVDGEQDHRQLMFEQQQHYRDYFAPAQQHEQSMLDFYQQITGKPPVSGQICIYHRQISTLAQHEQLIWFDFFALCSGPRSQLDYIWLADHFRIVMLSNVPAFSGSLIPAVFSGVEDSYQRDGVLLANLRQLDDEARRFIALVDELYDRGVRLVLSAEVDITELYQGEQLAFEFARCQSRLFEMQTLSYQ